MSDPLPPIASWLKSPHEAILSCGKLVAKLSLDHPEEGLGCLRYDDDELLAQLPGQLFSLTTAVGALSAASEVYVRGDDLISIHPPYDRFPFRTELLWSAFQLDQVGGVAVTLCLSLQTDLLNTHPELILSTALNTALNSGLSEASKSGAEELSPIAIGKGMSLYLAPHPSDAAEISTICKADQLQLKLTSPFLEKGVIRRCRVAALFLESDSDLSTAQIALAQFANSPLPLTT